MSHFLVSLQSMVGQLATVSPSAGNAESVAFDFPLWTYLLIPVSCGVIGYVTNVAAVKMMFYPIHFKGIPPFLGWRGIIPSNAVALVKNTHRLVMERLVSLRDIFGKTDTAAIIASRETELRALVSQKIHEGAETHAGPMWAAMSPEIQQQVIDQFAESALRSTGRLLRRVTEEIESLINLEGMSVYAAKNDPEFMNRMFLDVGQKEFTFIERSGLYFGFLFGLVQMVSWYFLPSWWLLPLFGLFVGWATNAIAIKLIFEPRDPKRLLGLKVQGLFHQRQQEVSDEFGRLVASVVFSDERLIEELSKPQSRETIQGWAEEEIENFIEELNGHPMRAMIPDSLIDSLRDEFKEIFAAEFESSDGLLNSIASQSDPLRKELQSKMKALDPLSFENVLRPAFPAEEWKLIAAGAILGFGAGFCSFSIYLGRSGHGPFSSLERLRNTQQIVRRFPLYCRQSQVPGRNLLAILRVEVAGFNQVIHKVQTQRTHPHTRRHPVGNPRHYRVFTTPMRVA